MVCAIAKLIKSDNKVYGYSIYETNNRMLIPLPIAQVYNMLKNNTEIVNLYIDKYNKIALKKWSENLGTIDVDTMTLIENVYFCIDEDENGYNILNSTGRCTQVEEYKIQDLIKRNKIINCKRHRENGKIKCKVEYTEHDDPEYLMHIKKEYDTYASKCKLMGSDIEIDCAVAGKDVILTAVYSNNSHLLVLPNFITIVGSSVLRNNNSDITDIRLNEGLKFIGHYAFASAHISQITIPKSVEVVGINAFRDPYGIVKTLDPNEIKLLNPNTIMLRME